MPGQSPQKIVIIYSSALGLWLLLSGALLASLSAHPGAQLAAGIAAGLVAVIGSACLLHRLISALAEDLRRKQATLAESLDLFDLTLSTLEETVLVLGPETGKIIRGNATAEKMFGYSLEELVGQNTRLFHVDQEAFTQFEEKLKITTGNMGFFRIECEMRRKNGDLFPAELFLRPNRKRDGLFYVVYVIRDLTEKKRIEEEIARVQRLESLGIVAGGIAHDFNNMLTAIVGNITLAKMQLKPADKAFAMLSDSEAAALKAKALTQRLQTFTKGGDLIRRVIQLEDSLRQMVEFPLRGSRVISAVRLTPDIWPVEVDEGQISQVVNNLVINAVQAMPQGGSLEVEAENFIVESSRSLSLGEGRYVKMTFRDTGTGISPENLPRIFDPYFTTKKDGSGLGLATSYSIIHKHGGRIDVESRLGAGSVFTIYLPAKGGKVRKSRGGQDELFPGTGRVLVMDDETAVRKLASEMIQALGYQVETAENSDAAVQMFKHAREENVPFDAVLVDLTVPGESGGKDTVRRLLEMDNRARVIVSSAYPSDPVIVNFQDYGFREVIAKPYTSIELSRVLHQVLAVAARTDR